MFVYNDVKVREYNSADSKKNDDITRGDDVIKDRNNHIICTVQYRYCTYVTSTTISVTNKTDDYNSIYYIKMHSFLD